MGNILQLLEFRAIQWLLNVYQFIFACVGICLEGRDTWIEQVPQWQLAQEYIFKYAKFLVELWGRGVFYVFMATIQLHHYPDPFFTVTGVFMLVVGGLTVSMHFQPDVTKQMVRGGVQQMSQLTKPYAAQYDPVDPR